MNACRPLQMPPAPKNVLMAIADRARDNGIAWPSIPGLCEATCYRRTAVIEAVKWLERAGFVAIEKSAGCNNRFTIDLDRIKTMASASIELADECDPAPRPADGPVRQTDPSACRTPTRPRAVPPPVRETDLPVRQTDPNHQEPLINHQTTTNRVCVAAGKSVHFAAFWAAYPHKVGKHTASTVFAKLGVDESLLATMVTAISRQTTSDQWRKDSGRFIPHPTTWLNDRRWEDDAPPVVGGDDGSAWAIRAGFPNRWEAQNAGCFEHTAKNFANGKRMEIAE